MSFYANQEILRTIELERTRESKARRQFVEARRLTRKNRRERLSQWIDTRRSERTIASSEARHLVAKS